MHYGPSRGIFRPGRRWPHKLEAGTELQSVSNMNGYFKDGFKRMLLKGMSGTSLQGMILVSPRALRAAFGEPDHYVGDGETTGAYVFVGDPYRIQQVSTFTLYDIPASSWNESARIVVKVGGYASPGNSLIGFLADNGITASPLTAGTLSS